MLLGGEVAAMRLELAKFLLEGSYGMEADGTTPMEYKHKGILCTEPALAESAISTKFVNTEIPRVRASSYRDTYGNMKWWLENASKPGLYISCGNPDVISIPKKNEDLINKKAIGGRPLIMY